MSAQLERMLERACTHNCLECPHVMLCNAYGPVRRLSEAEMEWEDIELARLERMHDEEE